jgi:hypothetical protein
MEVGNASDRLIVLPVGSANGFRQGAGLMYELGIWLIIMENECTEICNWTEENIVNVKWKILHKKELHYFCSSLAIIRLVKERQVTSD